MTDRKSLRVQYGQLFDDTAALFLRHDPMGINYEVNADEYEPEAGTVLPRLHEASNVEGVHRILWEEFERWFGPGSGLSEPKLDLIAAELWAMWSSAPR